MANNLFLIVGSNVFIGLVLGINRIVLFRH